jgi:hypothetical protein
MPTSLTRRLKKLRRTNQGSPPVHSGQRPALSQAEPAPMHPSFDPQPAVAEHDDLSLPLAVGLALGVALAVAPFGIWWLPPATVYATSIAFIAAVYLGFAVADGRRKVIVVEGVVAGAFVLVAALGAAGSPWLLVAGLVGHGCKDLWQHRTGFVRGTRWWPPFCVAVDWVAGAILSMAILTGLVAL